MRNIFAVCGVDVGVEEFHKGGRGEWHGGSGGASNNKQQTNDPTTIKNKKNSN